MRLEILSSTLILILLAVNQALAYDQVYGSPDYCWAGKMSSWGNSAYTIWHRAGELGLAAYTAVLGSIHLRGWMHRDLKWTDLSGPATARFDFGLCAEVFVGTPYAAARIVVTGFLRDIDSATYVIKKTLYTYAGYTSGYHLIVDGKVVNQPFEVVQGHRYTIGYTVDVYATCYPRSMCPTASVNMGEQGCSFWWQPTGIFAGW